MDTLKRMSLHLTFSKVEGCKWLKTSCITASYDFTKFLADGSKTAITSVIFFFFQNPNLFCDRLGLCKNIDTHNRPSRPSAKALHQNTCFFFLVQFAHFCFWSEETQL